MLNYSKKYQKAAMRICLTAFPSRFKNMPTKRALEILTEMGYGLDRVWWVSISDATKRSEWSVNRFSSGTITESFLLAREITNLEFVGGPPSRLKLHRGTLLSLLMDRLLRSMDAGGFKALDAIVPLSETYSHTTAAWS